ncbi:MAG: selenocysteine-specific translation elongation factor [Candidatus Marinimicrobia bacterium]|nr:selenocysteine-specific translation elongation factor [Candidatus Neomarinimicrobiota bacterium]
MLVQALTGVDTDTQPEEKRRGMTIDIGFAFLTENITLVDVPGHDRFIRNMVRGVAGIHLGLLVVAADDGVMPQTREHLQILRFLGVPRICVAVTKTDLVEADWLGLVEADIGMLLAGTPYQGSPVARVSAATGDGVEVLRQTLLEAAEAVPQWVDRGFFRLPVDRVFSLKGFGTVVTGTVTSGAVKMGDLLELVPGRRAVKLRGIQSHGADVEGVALGDRAALNIGNLSTTDLSRGEQLATPGYVATTRALAVTLTLLDDAPPLPHNHPVRINVGTAEVMAQIKFPGGGKLQPGSAAGAILNLRGVAPVTVGDRFILRSFSPVATIGGGTVLDVELPPRWKERKRWLNALSTVEDEQRLPVLIASAGARPFTLQTLVYRRSHSPEILRGLLPGDLVTLGRSEDPWLLMPQQAADLTREILAAVASHHQAQPYSKGANREHIRQQVRSEERFLEQWLREMVARSELAVEGETWRLPGFSIQLTDDDTGLLDRLVATVKDQGFATEYLEELATRLEAPAEQLRTLVALAEDRGKLVRISRRMVLHPDATQRLITGVQEHFREQRELTVADLKALTGTTRKFAVPLLEYLDQQGHTVRVGDKRVQPDG